MIKHHAFNPPLSGILFCVLFLAALLVIPSSGEAKQDLVDVEGAQYSVGASLLDNLKGFTGKKVSLTLVSGGVFTGYVKDVGTHLVHLEKLEGREYFDALIRIDSIIAMDSRFRQIQR